MDFWFHWSELLSTGAIKTVKIDAPDGAVVSSGAPTQMLEARTITGAEAHGFSFDTNPGAVVTLEAAAVRPVGVREIAHTREVA